MTANREKLNASYRVSFSQSRSTHEDQEDVNIPSTRNRSPGPYSINSSTDNKKDENSKGSKNQPSTKGTLCKVFLRTITLVLLYYTSSIGLTFYQKWLLKVNQILHLKFIKFSHSLFYTEISLPTFNCYHTSRGEIRFSSLLSSCVGSMDATQTSNASMASLHYSVSSNRSSCSNGYWSL
jgi:hypothetical protein